MQNVATPDPGQFATEYRVMKHMGWGWVQLCEAPGPLIDEILLRMQLEGEWSEKKRKLDEARREQRG